MCHNQAMTHRFNNDSSLARRLSLALASRDLDALGELLSDDVTWGDVTNPRRCRNRSDVLATFSRLLDFGVSGNITEIATGSRGILVGLEVTWPEDSPRESDTSLFQVYLVRDDKIVEIRRFDDRTSAARVAGLRASARRVSFAPALRCTTPTASRLRWRVLRGHFRVARRGA